MTGIWVYPPVELSWTPQQRHLFISIFVTTIYSNATTEDPDTQYINRNTLLKEIAYETYESVSGCKAFELLDHWHSQYPILK